VEVLVEMKIMSFGKVREDEMVKTLFIGEEGGKTDLLSKPYNKPH